MGFESHTFSSAFSDLAEANPWSSLPSSPLCWRWPRTLTRKKPIIVPDKQIFSLYTSSREDSQSTQTNQQTTIDFSKDKDANAQLDKLLESTRGGASTFFLVRAADIAEAVSATLLVFAKGQSVDRTPDRLEGVEQTTWAAVFLGHGANYPASYRVEKVELEGKSIRVYFGKSKGGFVTRDRVPYLYWVNLGQVQTNVYKLELIDVTDPSEPVLTRKVTVK